MSKTPDATDSDDTLRKRGEKDLFSLHPFCGHNSVLDDEKYWLLIFDIDILGFGGHLGAALSTAQARWSWVLLEQGEKLRHPGGARRRAAAPPRWEEPAEARIPPGRLPGEVFPGTSLR